MQCCIYISGTVSALCNVVLKMFDNRLWIRLEIGLEAPYKGFNVLSEKLAYSAHLYYK